MSIFDSIKNLFLGRASSSTSYQGRTTSVIKNSPSPLPSVPSSVIIPKAPSPTWQSAPVAIQNAPAQVQSSSRPRSRSSAPSMVYDRHGQPEPLGAELSRGGEGVVYFLINRPETLVKLYHAARFDKAPGLSAKLQAMTSLPLKDDRRFAWPRTTVHDDVGKIIGFAMRKVEGISFQTFCQPSLMQQRLPGWTRKQSVLVARNFVKLIQTLHQHGVIAGDINPANFLVNPTSCEVACLDCDSYQVQTPQQSFICTVAVPEFQPPELQNNFSSSVRTIEHEHFSVAIMLFKILMLGLHPYSHKSGGHPVENLQKGKCPFEPDQNQEVKFPAGQWPFMWSHLPYATKNLFIRAFVEGHGDPAARPTLNEWTVALQAYDYELKQGWHSDELIPTRKKSKTKSLSYRNSSAQSTQAKLSGSCHPRQPVATVNTLVQSPQPKPTFILRKNPQAFPF